VTPVGARSSVVGGAVPAHGGAVLDLSAMNHVLGLDAASQLVTAQAGVRGDVLEAWCNERGVTLGHYPQSLHLSTLGGWVATRASGTFSSGYGSIENLVDGLRVILPSGERVAIAACPRRSAGPELAQLFLGSEGALGVVTQVDVRVHRLPEERQFAGVVFADLSSAISAIRELAQVGPPPAVVRLYDAAEAARLLEAGGEPPGSALLVLGWDGDHELVDLRMRHTRRLCASASGRWIGAAVGDAWFADRFDVSALETAIARPAGLADTIEVSMRWRDAEAVYDAAVTAAREHADRVLAHFSHVYVSGTSLYVIFAIEAESEQAAERRYAQAWRDITEAAMDAGASLSHHHGVGLARTAWMAREHGAGLRVLRAVKAALDPAGILNPGKLLGIDD
jgi:alkyldihydroxyacetonephosphate synthase